VDERPPKLPYARPIPPDPPDPSGELFARHLAVLVSIAGAFAAIGTALILALRWLGLW
jgi:hypothetical protein